MKGEDGKSPKQSVESGFLSRWSQRKRGGASEPEGSNAEDSEAPAQTDLEEPAAPADWSEDQVQAKLSEIEGMKQGDDFKPLLAAGLPEVVKRAALRKLWRSHPAIGFIDGLDDYNEDYTIKPGIVAQVRSAYRAGEGYVYDEQEEAKRQTEIAARRDQDRQRDRSTAESAAEDRTEESGDGEEPAETGQPEIAVADTSGALEDGKTRRPDSDSQSDKTSAPGAGHGRASARRWGGGSV